VDGAVAVEDELLGAAEIPIGHARQRDVLGGRDVVLGEITRTVVFQGVETKSLQHGVASGRSGFVAAGH